MMKANEFVKKHGWLKAYDIVIHIPDRFMSCYYDRVCYCTKYKKYSDRFQPRVSLVNIANLKRLVESYELIKKDFESVEIAEYEHMISGCYSDPYWIRIKQAIADVESCQ